MKTVIYITENGGKFEVARNALKDFDIELVQNALETPEIQSFEVREVAIYSAIWASNQLRKPIVLTDAGYYITALNGFPGPFIKYINNWFSAKDYIRLMEGRDDRSVVVKLCLAYCAPGQRPVVFDETFKGTIARSAGAKGATPINEIFIPEGYSRPESEIPWNEMRIFWKGNAWAKLAENLKESGN